MDGKMNILNEKNFDFLGSKIFKLSSSLLENFMQCSLIVKTPTFKDKLPVQFLRAKQSFSTEDATDRLSPNEEYLTTNQELEASKHTLAHSSTHT
jgi:hypothetical protein